MNCMNGSLLSRIWKTMSLPARPLTSSGSSFSAEGFLLSFSLPNFYFHATTAYDILRSKGVPLGKRDFLGRMRMKS